MSSERLPGKSMLWLHGWPIIEWVYRRVSQAKKLNLVVCAIPDTPIDKILVTYLQERKAEYFCGSENDVLQRFYQVACHYEASHIVRICADNPLVAGEEIDRLIEFYLANDCDYVYNNIPKGNSYPDGLGAEMVSFTLLEEIHKKANLTKHREHIFSYLWDKQDEYKIATFNPVDKSIAQPALKLDIDSPLDYARFLGITLQPEMSSLEVVNAFARK